MNEEKKQQIRLGSGKKINDTFLSSKKYSCLATIDSDGLVLECYDYNNLENGRKYFGVRQVNGNEVIDPVEEIKAILSSIRSKADYATCRALSEFYKVEINFAGHDIKLKDGKVDKSDIDSLFTSPKVHYILERKRTVGDDLLEQVAKTRTMYEEKLKLDGIEATVVSIVYSEAMDERIAKKLLAAGVHVLNDCVESRFVDDKEINKFLQSS
jgi:hypothetical protein